MSTETENVLDRVLVLEMVRVTEAAAIAAATLVGRGDEKAADAAAVEAMREALNELPIDGTVVIGEGAPRLPNTLFLAVEGWDSPQQLIMLDLAGVMVSAGSACSSGKVKPSKTISAMGLDALGRAADKFEKWDPLNPREEAKRDAPVPDPSAPVPPQAAAPGITAPVEDPGDTAGGKRRLHAVRRSDRES